MSKDYKPSFVDVLIKNVPYKTYQKILAHFQKDGFSVQGYEPNYHEHSGRKINEKDKT